MSSPPGGNDTEIIVPTFNYDIFANNIYQTILHTPGEPPFINNTDDFNNLYKNLSKQWCKRTNDIDYRDWLKTWIDRETAKKIIKINSECRCCTRHMINRPCYIDSNDNAYKYDEYTSDMKQTSACQCPCRHFNRFLVYSFND